MTNLKNEVFLQMDRINRKAFELKEITNDRDIIDHLTWLPIGQTTDIVISGFPATGEYTVQLIEKISKDLFILKGTEKRG